MFTLFRAIETGQKNFVTSFDERKIGIVETLVIYFISPMFCTIAIVKKIIVNHIITKVISAKKNSAVSWEMKLYQALLLIGRK